MYAFMPVLGANYNEALAFDKPMATPSGRM